MLFSRGTIRWSGILVAAAPEEDARLWLPPQSHTWNTCEKNARMGYQQASRGRQCNKQTCKLAREVTWALNVQPSSNVLTGLLRGWVSFSLILFYYVHLKVEDILGTQRSQGSSNQIIKSECVFVTSDQSSWNRQRASFSTELLLLAIKERSKKKNSATGQISSFELVSYLNTASNLVLNKPV